MAKEMAANSAKAWIKGLLASAAMMCGTATAQDVIVMKSGEEIEAKVMEVGEKHIVYKKWTNQDGPQYTTSKAKVLRVRYKNGEQDVFADASEVKEVKVVKEVKEETVTENSPATNIAQGEEAVSVPPMPKHKAKEHQPKKTKYNIAAVGDRNETFSVASGSPSGLARMSDGSYLSEIEAQGIMGKEYSNYEDNVRKMRAGKVMTICGGAGLVVGITLRVIGDRMYNRYYSEELEAVYWDDVDYSYGLDGKYHGSSHKRDNDGSGLRFAGSALELASCVVLPVGIVKLCRGKKKAKRMVNELNYEIQYANSDRIEPVQLKFETRGLGLGMALKF